MVDFATENYQNTHQPLEPTNGSLGSIGIYPAGSGAKPKKLSTAKQKQIIELFLNLYSSGFHLSEIVDFLDRSHLVESRLVSQMREDLSRGGVFQK